MAYEEPQWTAWKAFLNSLFRIGGAGYETISEQLLAIAVDPSERTVRQLFWRDDMEDYTTMKWFPFLGTETLQYVDTVPAFEGDHVLSVSRAGNTYCLAGRKFGAFKLGKISFEVRWLHDVNVIERLDFALYISDPSNPTSWVQAYLQWEDNKWLLGYHPGVSKPIPGGGEILAGALGPPDERAWNRVKLVADFSTRRYQRLITNALDLDLSTVFTDAMPYMPTPPGHYAVSTFLMGAVVRTAGQAVYFDDARIYLNEV